MKFSRHEIFLLSIFPSTLCKCQTVFSPWAVQKKGRAGGVAVGLCSSLTTLQASSIASVLLYFFLFLFFWVGVGVALCGLWDLSSLTWN